MSMPNSIIPVKIKTYQVGKRGQRGYMLSLPKVWIDDVGLLPGDKLDVYRDADDRLIIIKPTTKAGAA